MHGVSFLSIAMEIGKLLQGSKMNTAISMDVKRALWGERFIKVRLINKSKLHKVDAMLKEASSKRILDVYNDGTLNKWLAEFTQYKKITRRLGLLAHFLQKVLYGAA